MLKILVGLPESPLLHKIIDALSETLLSREKPVAAEFVNTYSKLGIEKTLAQAGDCNLLILNEQLEMASPIDEGFIDRLTDEYPNLGIVFIIQDGRYQSPFVRRLFERNLYTCLFEKDASIDNIVELAMTGRTKKEARNYYGLFGEDREQGSDIDSVIDENSVMSVLTYLSKCTEEDLNEGYNFVTQRFTDQQNIYLISRLPQNMIALLESNLNYRRYINMLEKQSAPEVPEKQQGKMQINLPTKTIVKKVVETEFAGPVVIGVGSVEGGVGSTFFSLMMAAYLGKHKKKVGIIEYNAKPSLSSLAERKSQPFDIGRIRVQTVPADTKGVNFTEFDDCHYVIVDLGVLKPFDEASGVFEFADQYFEMTRSHCQVLIGSAAPWRIGKSVIFNYNRDNLQSWNLVLSGGAGSWRSGYKGMLEQYFSSQRIHFVGFCNDPLNPGEEEEEVLQAVLGRYAPQQKSNLLGFFKKGRK